MRDLLQQPLESILAVGAQLIFHVEQAARKGSKAWVRGSEIAYCSWSGHAELAVGCLRTSGMALRRHAGAFVLVAAVLVASLTQGAALSDRDAHLAHQIAAKVCPVAR